MGDIIMNIFIIAITVFFAGFGGIFIFLIVSSIFQSIKDRIKRKKGDPDTEKEKLISSQESKLSEQSKEIASLSSKLKDSEKNYQSLLLQYVKRGDEIKKLEKDLQKTSRVYYEENKALFESEHDEVLKENAKLIQRLYVRIHQLEDEISTLKSSQAASEKYAAELHSSLESVLQDHLKSFPYLAGMVADFLLVDEYAYNNYHGRSAKLADRKLRIDTLLKEKKELIARSKEIQYQLDFLLTAFPALNDFLDSEYKDIPLTFNYTEDHDPARDYLSADEYRNLSESERNQLALDRYIESHKKSKWQIGRDYELSVGYQYEKKGYDVQYTGSLDGKADLGRDLIATKGNTVLIIQCKYWSTEKIIREKHIAQLYGTSLCYHFDHPEKEVIPLFVTSTKLSDEAKSFADKLHVTCVENFAFKEFPRIKCNIGHNEFGQTKIYHLPMDQQYDSVIIDKPEESLVFTVKEAEQLGFRRAYHWHSF